MIYFYFSKLEIQFYMKLTCVIVDDSSLQRMIVSKLAGNHHNLKLVGEFSNALETKNYLSYNSVDLIFLDVEMPILNGFDFLDGLKVKPQVIFITSKPEYAVKAFDYDATDYLQKPITNARFEASVKRAINMQTLINDSHIEDGEHIFVKSNLKKLKIFTSKIKWIEAYGDYVKLITDDENHLVLSTMKAFENDLPLFMGQILSIPLVIAGIFILIYSYRVKEIPTPESKS